MVALRQGSPLPARMLAVIEVRTERRTTILEKALLLKFRSRQSNGEWFRFNFNEKEDKKAFNKGCREVFKIHLEKEKQTWWTQMNISVLDEDSDNLPAESSMKRRPRRFTNKYIRSAQRDFASHRDEEDLLDLGY